MRSLIIQCNNTCPCYCPGCYNFFPNKLITHKDIDTFVARYKELYGLSKVTLSGGDPLLNVEIATIIDNLSKQHISVIVDTVGTIFLHKIDNCLLSSLRKITLLGIPLDGVCDETIQLFRKNCRFEQCITIIELAQKIVPNICINTVVHAGNIDVITKIAAIVNNDSSITKWQLFQYMPIGPGGFSKRFEYVIEDQVFNALKDTLIPIISRKSILVEFKSIEDRKDKYLILGSDGVLWLPRNGPNRIVIGSIFDADIFNSLNNYADEDI